MKDDENEPIVISDTSVIINFIHLNKLDLFGELPFQLLIPEVVYEEVDGKEYPEQKQRLKRALQEGEIDRVSIENEAVTEKFAAYRDQFGKGESACLALAEEHDWMIACDEKRAFRKTILQKLGEDRLLNTPGVIINAIRENLIDVQTAEKWKEKLKNNGYFMDVDSFRNIVLQEQGQER